MEIRVLGNRLCLEIIDKRNTTKSGIFVPVTDNNSLVPSSGIIISVGNDVVDKRLVPGEKVLIEKYTGHKIVEGDKNYLIISEGNVLALLPEDFDVEVREDNK